MKDIQSLLAKYTTLGCLALAILGVIFLQSAHSEPSIEEVELAFESDFRKFGQPVSTLPHSTRGQYVRSLNKFPHYKACELSEKARTSNGIDLDFEQINTFEDIEVCLFWVADEMEDPEKFASWLNSEGFETILLANQARYQRQNVTHIFGQWNLAKQGSFSPFNLTWTTDAEIATFADSGLRVDVFFDQDMKVFLVETSYSGAL